MDRCADGLRTIDHGADGWGTAALMDGGQWTLDCCAE